MCEYCSSGGYEAQSSSYSSQNDYVTNESIIKYQKKCNPCTGCGYCKY